MRDPAHPAGSERSGVPPAVRDAPTGGTHPGPPAGAPVLHPGDQVEVRTRFLDGRWSGGFTVAEVRSDGLRLRRTCDGSPLPEVIAWTDARPVGLPGSPRVLSPPE